MERLQLATLITGLLTWFTLQIFTIVILWRHLQGHLITESRQVISLLITLSRTDVAEGYAGAKDKTVTDDWLDLI